MLLFIQSFIKTNSHLTLEIRFNQQINNLQNSITHVIFCNKYIFFFNYN